MEKLAEVLGWLVEHWEAIGAIVGIIAALVGGKKALAYRKLSEFLVRKGGGSGNKEFRLDCRAGQELGELAPDASDVLNTLVARDDPKKENKEKAGSVGKRVLKSLVPNLLRRLILRR